MLPAVDFDRHAAQRRHGVDQQQRPAVVHQLGDLLDRLPGAGRGFGHHDADHLGLRLRQGRFQVVRRENLAPGAFDFRDLGAGALGDVDHPPAEHAVDADHHRVARLDQVDDRRLHAGRAGAADRPASWGCVVLNSACSIRCMSFMISR